MIERELNRDYFRLMKEIYDKFDNPIPEAENIRLFLLLILIKRISDTRTYIIEQRIKGNAQNDIYSYSDVIIPNIIISTSDETGKKNSFEEFPATFDEIFKRKEQSNIIHILEECIKEIVKSNQELFSILDDDDLLTISSMSEQTEIIRSIINGVGNKNIKSKGRKTIDLNLRPSSINDFDLMNISIWLVRNMIPRKQSGLVLDYSLSNLLHKLAGTDEASNTYDPFCFVDGIVLNDVSLSENSNCKIYAQSLNAESVRINNLIMLIAAITDAKIDNSDSITNPFIDESGHNIKFSSIVTAIPFGKVEQANKMQTRQFTRYLRPEIKDDWENIEFIINSLEPQNGKAAILINPVILNYTGKSEAILKKMIDDNILDAVISISNTYIDRNFQNAVILLFDKTREKANANEDTDKVLFVDANNLLGMKTLYRNISSRNTQEIFDWVKERKEEVGISALIPNQSIIENNYDINIQHYVLDEIETISSEDFLKKITTLEREISELSRETGNLLGALERQVKINN